MKKTLRRLLHLPETLSLGQGLWQRFSFSDVNPLMKELRTRAARRGDIDSSPWTRRIFADQQDYPALLSEAVAPLRRSVMRTIARCERVSLWKMFFIHMIDVIFSIAAALMAIRILKVFEQSDSLLSTTQKVAVALALALGVFFLNVIAAALHAQKIEREMFVFFRVQSYLTRTLNEFVLNMSRNAKARYSTGDVVNLAQTDARHVGEFFAHAAVDFPVLFFSSALIVFVLWWSVGPAAFIAFAILLLQIPVSLLFSKVGQRFHHELMRRSDRRLSLVTEWIQAARLVRYFGWSPRFVEDISTAARKEFRQDLKLKAHYSGTFAISTSWWMIVAIGVFAGFLWFHSGQSASQVFAAIWLSSILGQQLNPLPWFVRIFSEAKVGSRRLQELFVQTLQVEEFARRGFSVLPDNRCSERDVADVQRVSFVLEDVWVEWPESSTPALQAVSCRIPAGGLTAIVGPVGAGKSVFLQTLMGEITPTQGQVKIEADVVLNDGRRESLCWPVHTSQALALLRRIQTFVPQEAFVAAATVRENIPLRYLSPEDWDASFDARVVSALEKAQLALDVESLPLGLATELGERGVNLSGGQKQRLSLARATFAERRLILLDDPLSAVDTQTEDRLVEELLEGIWNNSQTVIWATHRLAHLSKAAHILVLESGRIVEQGSWTELHRTGTRLSKILSGGSQ
jgi:ABC-type multidrug transport system fused ATPase/permease subunit